MFELKERFDCLSYITERLPGSNGKLIYKFKGPFQEMADVVNRKNRNGRRYESKLWKRALADEGVVERLKSRRMLGELDHPSDEGQIRRTSHIITDVAPDYDKGLVFGQLEILNHEQGDAALLKALVEQGVELCVSSRGFGDFASDGCTIDPETFKLVTWDVVLDPSVSVAKLEQIKESVNKHLPTESQVKGRFLESPDYRKTVIVPGMDLKPETSIKPIQEKKRMEEKIEKLNEQLLVKSTALATAESTVLNLKEKVQEKNEGIAKLEKANETLRNKVEEMEKEANEAATLIEKLDRDLKEAKKTLVEYSAIEKDAVKAINAMKNEIAENKKLGDQAAKVITEQAAKIKEQQALGDKAAKVINELMAGKKPAKGKGKGENATYGPGKPDTNKGAAGKDMNVGEDGEPAAGGSSSSSSSDDDGKPAEECGPDGQPAASSSSSDDDQPPKGEGEGDEGGEGDAAGEGEPSEDSSSDDEPPAEEEEEPNLQPPAGDKNTTPTGDSQVSEKVRDNVLNMLESALVPNKAKRK